jgi:hypothetical protein
MGNIAATTSSVFFLRHPFRFMNPLLSMDLGETVSPFVYAKAHFVRQQAVDCHLVLKELGSDIIEFWLKSQQQERGPKDCRPSKRVMKTPTSFPGVVVVL